jgi:hypothetical protein
MKNRDLSVRLEVEDMEKALFTQQCEAIEWILKGISLTIYRPKDPRSSTQEFLRPERRSEGRIATKM